MTTDRREERERETHGERERERKKERSPPPLTQNVESHLRMMYYQVQKRRE